MRSFLTLSCFTTILDLGWKERGVFLNLFTDKCYLEFACKLSNALNFYLICFKNKFINVRQSLNYNGCLQSEQVRVPLLPAHKFCCFGAETRQGSLILICVLRRNNIIKSFCAVKSLNAINFFTLLV